jgi:hypothetical protein
MGNARLRRERRQEILVENPNCYYCGGLNESQTIDHVPPKACFPDGYHPDGFEFAACSASIKGR